MFSCRKPISVTIFLHLGVIRWFETFCMQTSICVKDAKKRKTCIFVALDVSHCFLHILCPPTANEINDILSNDQFEGLFWHGLCWLPEHCPTGITEILSARLVFRHISITGYNVILPHALCCWFIFSHIHYSNKSGFLNKKDAWRS